MTKQTYRFIGTILLTASLLSLGGCSKEEASKYLESAADQAVSAAWDYAKEAVKGQLNDKTNPEIQSSSGTLNVHFIDVGQGDSILIQDGTHFMLVDAGENDQGDTVVNYLKEQGVHLSGLCDRYPSPLGSYRRAGRRTGNISGQNRYYAAG